MRSIQQVTMHEFYRTEREIRKGNPPACTGYAENIQETKLQEENEYPRIQELQSFKYLQPQKPNNTESNLNLLI